MTAHPLIIYSIDDDLCNGNRSVGEISYLKGELI